MRRHKSSILRFKPYKKIDGKYWHFSIDIHKKKSDAQRYAKEILPRVYRIKKARVIKVKGGWAVYYRPD